LQFTGKGKIQKLRINLPEGETKILSVGEGNTQTVTY